MAFIIPTWQEAPLIEDAVRSAQKIGDEVIVADAASPDGTSNAAQRAGARIVLTSSRCRGAQLHAGARVASGDVLLFLHADARLPASAREAILDALMDPLACASRAI